VDLSVLREALAAGPTAAIAAAPGSTLDDPVRI
jgi:hypothetical protein